MRICFFTRSDVAHPNSGGMETQGKLLAEGLVKKGHQVVMITTAHSQNLEKEIRNGVEIYYLKNAPSGVYSREWWEESIRRFNTLHRGKSFDLVLSQSVSGWGYLRAKKQFGVPCVAIMHGTTFRELKTRWVGVSSPQGLLRFLKEATIRLQRYTFRWLYWFRKFDAFIAVSEAVRGSLIENYFLNPQKVFTVYNGIEIERFANRKPARQLPDGSRRLAGGSQTVNRRKVILYLGRLDRDKGIEILLKAVSSFQLPVTSYQLLVVGDGHQREELKAEIKKLEIEDRVKLVGQVPYEETPKYYQQADVFVYPSQALEGLPMSLVEAMAAGKPVVASKVGGVPEAVVDGETGLLVEPGNVPELSAALEKLLTNDGLREKMGQRAQEVAKEKFSQGKMVKNTLEVLQSIF